MGGNALKVETVRKTTEEFNRIVSEIVPIIESKLNTETFIVKCFRNKETHGDMDILVKIGEDQQGIDYKKFVSETFNPRDIHKNSDVVSFDYDNFQIDFISISESNWEVAKTWYSYDPFSNLVGKAVHKFGLKYGHSGLRFPFRNFSGRMTKDIVISKSPEKIFEFLGYDFERFDKGFDTLQEIFDFIIDNKYFNYTSFLMENLNQIDRKRNKKRPTYQMFLKYMKDNDIKVEYDFDPDKSVYIDMIEDFFPESNLRGEIEKLTKSDEENYTIRKKFGGKSIMKVYPGLEGIELGRVMDQFYKSFEDFRSFALEHSGEEIMKEFIKFYETKKEAN